jgi:hypothetical protein
VITEYLEIVSDPAHGLAEITYSLVIDLLVFGLIWGTLWTKWLKPKLKREVHSEIDQSHGYVHDEGEQNEEDFERTGYQRTGGDSSVRVFRYVNSVTDSDSDRITPGSRTVPAGDIKWN